VTVLESIQDSGNIESIVLKVQIRTNKSFIVVCVYRPPNRIPAVLKSDSDYFEEILDNIPLRGRSVFITGDFNLPTSLSYSYFEHILHSHSLWQLVNQPTRLENLLDLFITNNRDINIISEVKVEEPHISDHRMLISSITIPRPECKKKNITYRDFKNANYESLGLDICNILVPGPEENTTTLVHALTSNLLCLFDKYVPVVTKKITERSKALCLSEETLLTKTQRDIAYKTATQDPTVENVNTYNLLNKSVKKLITQDSKDTINCMIKKQGVFNAMKSFCKLKSDKASENFSMDVNLINEYFVNISTNDQSSPLILPFKPPEILSPSRRFVLTPITKFDLIKAWKSMKKRKSNSIDTSGLSSKMIDISIGAPNISELLVNIVNSSSISSSEVPESIKLSKVIPLAKVSNPSTPSQLRPIAI